MKNLIYLASCLTGCFVFAIAISLGSLELIDVFLITIGLYLALQSIAIFIIQEINQKE